MTFAEIERLKAELTDRTVEVDPSVPELRRFQGLIGTVKTVNMNGRTLVQFDHPVDISWYDIHPTALRFVERKPKPEKVVEKGAAAPAKAPAAKPAAAAPAPAAPAAAAPAATGDKPLSKIEMARMQAKAAAAAAAGTSAPAAPATTASAPAAPAAAAPAPAPGGKPLSKLEMARMQGAMKAGGAAAAPAAAPAPPPPAAAAPAKPADAAPAPQPKPAAAAPMVDESGKPLSKLEMARRQGAAKNK